MPPIPPPGGATAVTGRIFDDEEKLLRDFRVGCSCLTRVNLIALQPVYSDPVLAPNGTYTELRGRGGAGGNRRFTGYLGIRTTMQGATLDVFERLHNGPAESIFARP